MTNTTFFIIFIPLLSVILLAVNLLLAPHNPYQEKDSAFECGFDSFLLQNRTEFAVSFFIYGLLFLLFDLEILLVYPFSVSSYTNDIYGLGIMLIFFILLTLGFIFELGKGALNLDSKQTSTSSSENIHEVDTFIELKSNVFIPLLNIGIVTHIKGHLDNINQILYTKYVNFLYFVHFNHELFIWSVYIIIRILILSNDSDLTYIIESFDWDFNLISEYLYMEGGSNNNNHMPGGNHNFGNNPGGGPPGNSDSSYSAMSSEDINGNNKRKHSSMPINTLLNGVPSNQTELPSQHKLPRIYDSSRSIQTPNFFEPKVTIGPSNPSESLKIFEGPKNFNRPSFIQPRWQHVNTAPSQLPDYLEPTVSNSRVGFNPLDNKTPARGHGAGPLDTGLRRYIAHEPLPALKNDGSPGYKNALLTQIEATLTFERDDFKECYEYKVLRSNTITLSQLGYNTYDGAGKGKAQYFINAMKLLPNYDFKFTNQVNVDKVIAYCKNNKYI